MNESIEENHLKQIVTTEKTIKLYGLVDESELQQLDKFIRANGYYTFLKHDIEQIIQKLRLLGKLEPCDRLYTKNMFNICPNESLGWFYRSFLWYSEDRHFDMMVIKNVFIAALYHLDQSMIKNEKTSDSPVQDERKRQSVDLLITSIITALDGIQNLLWTYKKDEDICCQIETFSQLVRKRIALC